MYLSKRSRKLLKAASRTAPTIQGKYHSGIELARNFHICDDGEAVLIVKLLKKLGLAEIPYDTCPELFFLTEPGKSYGEFRFHESLEFFKHSILCPIVVTITTELLIHGAPQLLQLILSLVLYIRNNPAS